MPPEVPLTTLESLRRASRLYARDVYIVLSSSVVLGVSGITIAITYHEKIRSFYIEHFDATVAEVLLGITPWLPSLIVLFVGLFLVERKRSRDSALVCPYCNAPLILVRNQVIATGNCPQCRQRIMSDAPPG